jgi:hypothetical protein
VTGHSHVLLDEVSGAALCLAAYMPAAILICVIPVGGTGTGRVMQRADPELTYRLIAV